MNEIDRRYIIEVANSFEKAPRLGEGQRYIQISDTLINMIAGTLKMIVERDIKEQSQLTNQSN